MSDAVLIALITGFQVLVGLAIKEYFDRERLRLLSKKVDVVVTKTDEQNVKLEEIHHTTNSMKDELVKAVSDARFAEGKEAGVKQEQQSKDQSK